MSTTVTYKGSTLTTVNNQTRTLKTAGKYMEGDVVLTDVSESGTIGNVWQDEQGYVHLDDEGEGSISVEALSVTQNGTYTAPTGKAYSPVTVNVSGGGGSGSTSDQVRFIDYDGSIVQSYSKSDFMALSAMPSNPTHAGLTSQGWNWSLADAKDYLTDYPDGDLTIGQKYITDDGKTRLYCHFEEGRLHPYLGICPNGTVVVDWGDGSATSTLTGTSLSTVQYTYHDYASAGDYIITLTVLSGSFAFVGHSNTSYILRKNATTTSNIHRVYTNCVQKIEMGASASIGSYAFNFCCSLVSVTIPDGVTSIGTYAFSCCYSLVNITIPDGVRHIDSYTFESCNSLINIAIPAGVTNIYSYAFRYCYSLRNITIPDGVTSIRDSTFNNCYSLTNITIPSGVTSIEVDAFNNCRSFTSIIIPDEVTSIGNSAFYSCSSLTNITIPDGVTSIKDSTFNNCYSLTNITIPSGVTSIGNSAFGYCYSLTSITIPSGVTSIGGSAFISCHSLTNITIPSGVTSIGDITFKNCSSLASITIPSSVTSIGSNAFYGCSSLASVTIPSGVTSIGTYAFDGCSSLASVIIPNGVTSFGNYVFYNCFSLASITIPNGVTNIGTHAFNSCYGMAEYHFLPITPPTLANTNAFTNIQSDCIIYVPQGSLEAYQTATNWSTYASRMQEEPA